MVFSTCDQQYRPADLDGMFKTIDQVDLVVGYRAGGQAPLWRVARYSQRGLQPGGAGHGAVATRVLVGQRGVGPVPGRPLDFRRARARSGMSFSARCGAMFSRLPIQSAGPFVQVEILAKANHLSCLLAEEPVTWTPPAIKASDAISFARDAWTVFQYPEFGPQLAAAANGQAKPS